MSVSPVSGAQVGLRSGSYEADIASIGASLRRLRFEGRDLVVPFAADEERPAMSGALLAPWTNRTADGRYEFGGGVHRLPVNEPQTGNAAHGLVAGLDFRVVEVREDSAMLSATIEPQLGYPWRVRVDTAFRLSEDGLHQEVVATNESDTDAPFGVGAHPYLVADAPARRAIDGWVLHVPAEEILLVSPDRLLPTDVVHVADQEHAAFDFRSPRLVGQQEINNAYSAFARDDGGLARVTVTADGVGAEIEWDERVGWAQVYTSDAADGEGYRRGVAVEPMTCPPDALNSSIGLLVIKPGEHASAGWTIRAVG